MRTAPGPCGSYYCIRDCIRRKLHRRRICHARHLSTMPVFSLDRLCYIGGNIWLWLGDARPSLFLISVKRRGARVGGCFAWSRYRNTNGFLAAVRSAVILSIRAQLGDWHRSRRRNNQHQGRRDASFLIL